jgi:hypothetical protein
LHDFSTPIRSPGDWIALGRLDQWSWCITKGGQRF